MGFVDLFIWTFLKCVCYLILDYWILCKLIASAKLQYLDSGDKSTIPKTFFGNICRNPFLAGKNQEMVIKVFALLLIEE